MILPLLMLSLACPVQDAPAAPATQAAAPTESAAAPTETPAKVREFLTDAQSHLYDPQAAGLKSLAFDVDVDHPMLGDLGTVHATWESGKEAEMVFTAKPDVSLPPGVSPMQIELQSKAQAQQLLGGMLNRTIASLLDEGVASMAGVQDELVGVKYDHPMMASQGVKSQMFFFDDEGQLKKSTTEIEQQGMTIKMVQNYKWKPAAEGTELLVADTQAVEMDFGMMKQSSSAVFTYSQAGAIVLPVKIATSSKGPMGGEQVLMARNLVVNGQTVPDMAAPASADPAAPRPPAGG
jgi:hypothetical protein